jgi:hypothetical protein
MKLRDKHFIMGKWVDCKSAIPVNQMKIIELKAKQTMDISEASVLSFTENQSRDQIFA